MTQKHHYSISLLSIMILLGVSLGITSELAFAEIETDKSVYLKGEPVEISGTIDFQDEGERVNIVEIKITNSDTNNTVVNEYTPIDGDDSFSRSYDSAVWPSGEYQVIISYNDVEEMTEFEVSNSSSSSSSSKDNNNESDSEDSNNAAQQQESSSISSTSSDVPPSPTDLNADVVSSTQIDLSWSAPDGDSSIIGYKIEYRVNTVSTYSVAVANTGSNLDTTYSHTGLTPDTVYAYRISAINSAGESEPSSSITVKTSKNESSINASNTNVEDIDTPTDVVAKAISSTSVELNWNHPTQTYGQTIEGYTIKQEIIANEYNEIVSNISGSSTTYTISDLNTDETYTFVVVADYALGSSSDVSEKATVTLTSTFDNDQNSNNESQDNNNNSAMSDNVPDIPTNLQVKPISSTQIDLSWSAPQDDDSITGYKVEVRTVDNESYSTVVDNTESTDTTYSHTDLIPETTYIYRVSAINDVGTGMPSEGNLANTLPLDPEDTDTSTQNDLPAQENIDSGDSDTASSAVPSSPVDLKATPVSQSRIDLSWSVPIDTGASALLGYKIESKTSDESDYSALVTNTGTASTTTYSHTGLTAGLTYQYRIFAINSSGESIPSEVSEATIILNNANLIDPQEPSQLQPIKVTLNTDRDAYVSDDSIEISGIITGSTQDMPLGLRITSSNDTIVYVRSISINNDDTFEAVISPTSRQSSVWQSNNEFTIEVTHNGRVQATTTFEISNENTNLTTSESTSTTQSEPESNEQQQSQSSSSSPLNDSVTAPSNNELDTLKDQNLALQSANQQLRDENNQFKTQVEELNKRIEQLDAIVKEQIRVMMETLGALKSEN